MAERSALERWRGLPLLLSLRLLLLFVAAVAPQEALLGGVFKVCSRSDPQLPQCLLDSLNGARTKLSQGRGAALGLPALSALRVKEMRVEEGENGLNLHVVFNNFTWRGLDDFVATRARINLTNPYIEIETVIGAQNLSGKYTFGGSVLTLRINGEGNFLMIFEGNITHRIYLEEVQKHGEKFWNVKDYKWDMIMTNYESDFKNLFHGNRRLGFYANTFINRNWKPAYQIYRGAVEKGIQKVIKEYIMDKFFSKVPIKSLLSL